MFIIVGAVQQKYAERAIKVTSRTFDRMLRHGQIASTPELPSLDDIILTLPDDSEAVETFASVLEDLASRPVRSDHDDHRSALLLAQRVRKTAGIS